MVKAIIFDCFGVVYIDRFGEVFEYFGGDLDRSHDFIYDLFHRSSTGEIEDAMPELTAHLGITEDEWHEEQAKRKGFNAELLEYTKELKKSFKVSMLSNIGVEGLAHHMDYGILEEHFEDIVESAKIGFAKPEARTYEIAAERLGLRLDECLFTDDRMPYIEGARSVGMKAILFENTDQFKKDLTAVLES